MAEKALDSHLAGLHSSIDQEAKQAAWRWDRYLRALARYKDAIGRCQPPRGEPDGAWAEALRKEFGVEQLKRNRRALVGAISVAHFRQLGTCTAAVRLELFEAERSYQSGVISSLREAVDFFTSVKVLPAGKNAELSHRAEILASVLRKLSIERLEHVDTAEIEMEAEKLPSDLSAALSRQSALSKPFDLVEMIHVLNRTLEKP